MGVNLDQVERKVDELALLLANRLDKDGEDLPSGCLEADSIRSELEQRFSTSAEDDEVATSQALDDWPLRQTFDAIVYPFSKRAP